MANNRPLRKSRRKSVRHILAITILAALFNLCIGIIAVVHLDNGRRDHSIYTVTSYSLAAIVVGIALLLFLRDAFSGPARHFRPYYLAAVIPVFVWLAVREYFGAFDINAIVYHLMAGVGGATPEPLLLYCVCLFAVAFFCLSGAVYMLGMYAPKLRRTVNLLAVPFLLFNPVTVNGVYSLTRPVTDLSPGSPHFAPADAKHPRSARQPNLIHIYLESTEATFAELDETRAAMEPLIRLTKRGFSATGISQIEFTGWTIAGQVASQCGVPLVYPWAQRVNVHPDSMDFMPGATCLTDILARDGYRTEFVKGFHLSFAGTDAFIRSHHYDSGVGLLEHPGFSGPLSEWGAYDDGILDFSVGEIERLHRAGEPFYFTLTTNGGHFPNGVLSPACSDDLAPGDPRLPLVAAIDCTNRLTGRFIDRLEKAGLLENTIVLLQSDHLMMLNPLDAQLDARSRRDLLIAFGPGVPQGVSDRPASMVDVYPTILELLGYLLPEHRAALGVSLLSDRPTLIEELGKDELDHSIGAGTVLARSLWTSNGKAVQETN